ncbi:MAG: ABC transporter permease [Burkholderiaceae bacterium]
MTSLRRSIAIQCRIVGALVLRETLTRYGRHNIGFLWMFVEPMMFTLGVTALWTALHATHGSNLPIVTFTLTGYSAVLLWRSMPGRLSSALEVNRALMHHRNVRVIDVYLSRILLEIGGVTTSFTVLTLVFAWSGLSELPPDPLLMIGGWIILCWFGGALALIVGAASERSEIVEKLWHPISYLSFPISGAAFMVDWLPPKLQAWALLLPPVNGVEMVRGGFYGHLVKPHYDIATTVPVLMVMTLVGLALVQALSRARG